jgi:site-specific DNA-cytosine methylase
MSTLQRAQPLTREVRHFHLFCGLGGGAKGFNRGHARVGRTTARFRCIGGIDNDPAAIKDFSRLAGAEGTCLDLFSRDQYIAFHGDEPPIGWTEATPQDLQRAASGERPHIIFLSAPCKGFSGLLPEAISKGGKYQALNALTLRGIWLALGAWKDDPTELIVFENVPRIQVRGRQLLDRIGDLLRSYGYAVAETTHDCGKLGGLSQSRKRFLLVARHMEKVPPFLYEPEKRSLASIGTLLARMPLPGDVATAGPMHRVPALQWKTWVRLAFVEAGSDWRSLNKLTVRNGQLADYLLMPESRWENSLQYGVNRWDTHSGTIAARSHPANGRFSVADPRIDGHPRSVQLGVRPWNEPAPVVTGKMMVGGGPHAVADPRIEGSPRFNSTYRIVPWDDASPAVAGPGGPAGGLSVADPRPVAFRNGKDNYLTGGHYGVVPWNMPSYAITANGQHNNGFWSLADPRLDALPDADEKLTTVIRALDGTWHRPFTTLELAALQSLLDPEEHLELEGLSDAAWRERIGNAVPPKAAEAIAGVMGTTLLLAWSGATFTLNSMPIWVRPVAIGLTLSPS